VALCATLLEKWFFALTQHNIDPSPTTDSQLGETAHGLGKKHDSSDGDGVL